MVKTTTIGLYGGMMVVSTVWISIVAGAGAFSVSLLSIYLGYNLFIAGATGAFKFTAQSAGSSVGIESVTPGIAFAFLALPSLCMLFENSWGKTKGGSCLNRVDHLLDDVFLAIPRNVTKPGEDIPKRARKRFRFVVAKRHVFHRRYSSR